jgi:hypothetical protein
VAGHRKTVGNVVLTGRRVRKVEGTLHLSVDYVGEGGK